MTTLLLTTGMLGSTSGLSATNKALLGMSTDISLISQGASAYGQYQQGSAQQEAYNEAADRVRLETAHAITEKRRETRKLSGQQKVLYAKAGVDLSSGSPLLVMAETARRGSEELWWLKKTGKMKASDLEKAGKAAKTAATIGATSTAFKGISNAGLGLVYALGGKQDTPTTGGLSDYSSSYYSSYYKGGV